LVLLLGVFVTQLAAAPQPVVHYTFDEVKIFDAALTEEEIKQVSVAASIESTGKLAVRWAEVKVMF